MPDISPASNDSAAVGFGLLGIGVFNMVIKSSHAFVFPRMQALCDSLRICDRCPLACPAATSLDINCADDVVGIKLKTTKTNIAKPILV